RRDRRIQSSFPTRRSSDLQTPEIPETCQWGMFLRNHDELTLEMVTHEERDYMYRVYARDEQARVNLGIRRRLVPLLGSHRHKVRSEEHTSELQSRENLVCR